MRKLSLLILAVFLLGGCANFRAYYNAYFNANKAYNKAHQLKKNRLKVNPNDTVKISQDENTQYQRAIAKGSKVLELYGHLPSKYVPKSLFLMGECYYELGEYGRAAKKYAELQKAYPNFKDKETARFHRAASLYHSAPYLEAKRELVLYIASAKRDDYKFEAMELYAELEKKNNSDSEGLKLFEELLAQKNLSPELKSRILFEACKTSFEIGKWEKAVLHCRLGDEKSLKPEQRFIASLSTARALYELGEKKEAIEAAESLFIKPEFTAYQGEAGLYLTLWYLDDGKLEVAKNKLQSLRKESRCSRFHCEAAFETANYVLKKRNLEKEALETLDSVSNCGDSLEFSLKSRDLAASIRRVQALRKDTSLTEESRDFLLAETFFFKVNNIDSALHHLDRVVENNGGDSTLPAKAAYARAFIRGEYLDEKARGDSLYNYLIEKFPNTEFAAQAERNMGRPPTQVTGEDSAHALFLKAEELYFSGYDLKEQVVPAYLGVVQAFPKTPSAAKAQFVAAMLWERQYEAGDTAALDSAKAAHKGVLDYPETDYFHISQAKLNASSEINDSLFQSTPVQADTTQGKEEIEFKEKIDSPEIME